MEISPSIDENIRLLQTLFADCGDFVGRKYENGLYMAYIDMLTDRTLVDVSIMGQLFDMQRWRGGEPAPVLFAHLKERGLPTADLKETGDMDALLGDMLSGSAALFVDGYAQALVISAKGFPHRGVTTAETEVVVQGSKEAFCEAFRVNTALVRRRIRDTHLKVKQSRIGRRSQTDVALLYMTDIARPAVVEALEARLAEIDIDGVADSGFLAQLIEKNWLSPFPQAQLTERPDKAASAILEGRVAVVVDNAPFALLLPVTLNNFFQSSEDYTNRWQIMSLTRLLRFAAALLSVMLPGAYLAIATFHPSTLPLLMITKMAEARQAVPFPAAVEVLLMDAAFELLREAGIRLPSAAGGTIGIVGGLIIGQAAVEAGLVSPIVVIVIALTGIASFAIPNVSLVNGFRLVKYLLLLLSAALGFFGFWMGVLLALSHVAALRSLGVPYLMPFAAAELNDGTDKQDGLLRLPLFTFLKRPFFAQPGQRVRQGRRKK